jgi:hypothetical protein
MAVGRDLRGDDEHVVVVAGDAALTCGISYEALNNVKAHTKKFIVVLNDNEWSIAKNVGAIASYLNSIATSPSFTHLHDKARRFIEAVAGKSAAHFAHKVEEGVKGLIVPSVIFEELGLRYYGPIDGHDIGLLTRTFEFLKDQDETVLIHILTKKGKGYEPAIKQPDKFHGLGSMLRPGNGSGADTDLFRDYREDLWRNSRTPIRKSSRLRPRCPAGRGWPILPRLTPPAFLCGYRRRTRRAFRVRTGHPGHEAISDDLLDFHAAGLRHDHSRHRAAKIKRRGLLHGSRRTEWRRRPDASWLVRHRLFAAHPELRAHATQG